MIDETTWLKEHSEIFVPKVKTKKMQEFIRIPFAQNAANKGWAIEKIVRASLDASSRRWDGETVKTFALRRTSSRLFARATEELRN